MFFGQKASGVRLEIMSNADNSPYGIDLYKPTTEISQSTKIKKHKILILLLIPITA
jgi:hypothetical protein